MIERNSLGKRVEDIVTNRVGTITGLYYGLYGSPRMMVQWMSGDLREEYVNVERFIEITTKEKE